MIPTKKRIEILYFDGCPNWQKAVDHVRNVVVQAGLEQVVSVQTVAIETDEQAQRTQFLGSPSVRVDGQDVERSAADRTDFGLQCRVYEHAGRLSGLPSADIIRRALDAGEGPCP